MKSDSAFSSNKERIKKTKQERNNKSDDIKENEYRLIEEVSRFYIYHKLMWLRLLKGFTSKEEKQKLHESIDNLRNFNLYLLDTVRSFKTIDGKLDSNDAKSISSLIEKYLEKVNHKNNPKI